MIRPYDWAVLDPLIMRLYSQPTSPGRVAVRTFCARYGINPASLPREVARLRACGKIRRHTHQVWTPAEVDILYRYWGLEARATTAGRVGRTVRGCASQALALHLKNGYRKADLFPILGVTRDMLTLWVEAGWLVGTRLNRADQGRQSLVFTDLAIARFLRDYRAAWETPRLPPAGRTWVMSFLEDAELQRRLSEQDRQRAPDAAPAAAPRAA